MHRFFGTKKEKAPAPTLGDASKSIDTRGAAIDAKIAALEKQILPLKQKLKTMRNGPSKKSVQRRAVMLLRQQKGYEKQRDTLYCQQANLDQTTFAMENLQDTKTMVSAMKAAGENLKQEFKAMDLDELEDLQDDMAELMEQNEEIQEIMGRSYAVPDELEDDDLLAELDDLEEEIENEPITDEVPDYLISANSATNTNTNINTNTNANANQVSADPYALPDVPARNIQI